MSLVEDGIYGVLVGDMLGVPVEFEWRENLKKNPVTGPREMGSHEQPLGSWSDDTSLTLALADSLADSYDLKVISQNFIDWWTKRKYTSHDCLFDIGTQTRLALNVILKILEAEDYESLELLYLEASEDTNGNGSLMRILPLYFYLKDKGIEDNFETIWQVSALTHPHIRAAIACLVYLVMLDELKVPNATPITAYRAMQKRLRLFFDSNSEALHEAPHFARLLDNDISQLPIGDIRSGGYVIETLEASIWCLLNTDSYQSAVLQAINLGHDTDTTGAVTGGLAGMYYGKDTIPEQWLDIIPKQDEIDAICDRLM